MCGAGVFPVTVAVAVAVATLPAVCLQLCDRSACLRARESGEGVRKGEAPENGVRGAQTPVP